MELIGLKINMYKFGFRKIQDMGAYGIVHVKALRLMQKAVVKKL